MTDDVPVEAFASALGIRFSLVGLFPTAFLVIFVLTLVAAGAPVQAPNLQAEVDKISQYNAAQGLLLGITILAGAFVLQPFQLLLVRVLEGYWGTSKLGGVASSPLVIRHRKKRNNLQARLAALLKAALNSSTTEETLALAAEAGPLSERIERFYPKTRLLPTTLGNVLRAAEENAGAPYELDVIAVWPRLYAILPERTAGLVDDQRNQLDIATRFCVMFGVATVVSVGLLYEHGWWLAVPLTTFALAWLCYRGAVASALAYGLGIRTAVDLHRFDLLRALHLPLPQDRETEKRMNKELSDFLRQGVPVNFPYEHSETTRDLKPR